MQPCNIMLQSSPLDTLLTRKEVKKLLDVSDATIYRWLKTNAAFPKQIKLNPNKKKSAVRWRLSEILAYLAASAIGTSTADQAALETEAPQ